MDYDILNYIISTLWTFSQKDYFDHLELKIYNRRLPAEYIHFH